MRSIILALSLAACQTADPAAGLVGPPGPQGEKGDPGPAGKDASPAKVLHLVVADTGDDLGVMIDLGIAYRADIASVVWYKGPSSMAYADADCRGTARMAAPPTGLANAVFIGPANTLIKPRGGPMQFHYRSLLISAKCTNSEGDFGSVREFDDMGIAARVYDASELVVELR